MKHKVGDEVTWTTQAGGTPKEKSGKVLATLRSGQSLDDAMRRLRPKAARTSVKADADTSICDRYLVEVPRARRGKASSACDYYAPRASVVDKQMEARMVRETL